jgi:arsenate reductase (glutaredoxin)
MSDLVYWHNPRCSKSREALALLHENGYQPAIVTYLTLPPTESELRRAISLLNLPVIAMMRVKEKRFVELGLHSGSTDDELIKAMAANPILIERPILFTATKAAIGRPVENVLKIL